MKCNRSHIAIFRGLHFEPDEEMELKNIFELAWTIGLGTIAPNCVVLLNRIHRF